MYSQKFVIFTVLALAIFCNYALARKNPRTRNRNELKRAEYCKKDKCRLPNCRCFGQPVPDDAFEGREQEIPQFVSVTFDDAVNAINFEIYQKLFDGLTNPDHCPSRGTFFVSHEYTDYVKLNGLYAEGHEVALHSVSHGVGTDYWRKADVNLLMREFGNQIDMIEHFAKINRKHIRGMRMPFLQLSGNATYIAAKRLGLEYDSSWPTQSHRTPGLWPYTMDYLSEQDCQIGPCPDVSVPGFWVSPMVSWLDLEGYFCAMLDACIYQPEDDVDELFNWMLENFNTTYHGNRAPFGMYLHASWFSRGDNYFKAFRRFLEHLSTMPDVYLVPVSKVIEYAKQPVLGKPFKGCTKKPITSCKKRSCSVRKLGTDEMRYITVCDRCPTVYPWLDNPLGKM